jgi:GNAT superfamily N-acetyltransferase
MADMADVAGLAELQDIESAKLAEYADWIAAHADTHLPFVAEVDGEVVGAAWLLIAERVPRNGSLDRRYGDVQSVMVREEYRNRGIGAALMAAILAEARARYLAHVTVHSGRHAVGFYLRNGFSHHRQLLRLSADPHSLAEFGPHRDRLRRSSDSASHIWWRATSPETLSAADFDGRPLRHLLAAPVWHDRHAVGADIPRSGCGKMAYGAARASPPVAGGGRARPDCVPQLFARARGVPSGA